MFCHLFTILNVFKKLIVAYALNKALGVDFILETVEQIQGLTKQKTVIRSDQGTIF